MTSPTFDAMMTDQPKPHSRLAPESEMSEREEPAVQSETRSDSPSVVRQHEIDMTLLLTKINQEMPDALTAEQVAKDRVRRLKLEKAAAERLLRTHHRIAHPTVRKRT